MPLGSDYAPQPLGRGSFMDAPDGYSIAEEPIPGPSRYDTFATTAMPSTLPPTAAPPPAPRREKTKLGAFNPFTRNKREKAQEEELRRIQEQIAYKERLEAGERQRMAAEARQQQEKFARMEAENAETARQLKELKEQKDMEELEKVAKKMALAQSAKEERERQLREEQARKDEEDRQRKKLEDEITSRNESRAQSERNYQATNPEALRELRELIRLRYALDIRIWSLQGCGKWDRPLVEEQMKRADAVLYEIRKVVEMWSEIDESVWTTQESKMIKEIRKRLMSGGQREWMKEGPPWKIQS